MSSPLRSAMRPALFGALLLAAGCAAGEAPRQAAAPADPAEAVQLDAFRRLVFGPPDGQLAKWQQPVRFALVDAPDGQARGIARRHFADLAALSGLAIEETGPRDANLVVFFADDPVAAARRHRGLYAHRIDRPQRFESLLAGMADSTCFGFLWGGWPGGRGIDFAVVFVRTDRGARTVEGCLVQQTTQVMGLRHDLDPAAESIFADTGRYAALTADDRLMVRLLYDSRLAPGMTWTEAEPLARAALRDLRKGGGG